MDGIELALHGVDPSRLLEQNLKLESESIAFLGSRKKIDLRRYDQVYVVGGGKASGAMAVGLEHIMLDYISAGYVNVLKGTKARFRTKKIRLNEASHPVPDQAGVRGTREMVKLLRSSDERTLVICLISGGGSSLIPLPAQGVTLSDLVKTTNTLLRSGSDIDRMNCIRKHISGIKGGQLARYAEGATILSLIISDVVGDHLESIASGPTVPDPTTFVESRKILAELHVSDKVPSSVRQRIDEGCAGRIPETPKPGDPIFSKVTNSIIGSNEIACRNVVEHFRRSQIEGRPLNVSYLGSSVTGEASKVASRLVQKIERLAKKSAPRVAAVVWGGETTVTVRGNGIGGRNQEEALSALGLIGRETGSTTLTAAFFGTDGIDGKTGAAGAIVDLSTIKTARKLRLDVIDYLERNDSNTFFRRVRNSLIITGATGTNVNDIGIAIARLRSPSETRGPSSGAAGSKQTRPPKVL